MKTMRYMIAATIISAALFTGCKKEDSMTGIAAEQIGNGTAKVTFQLQTLLPPTGSLVKWDKGYITVSDILFNGSHYNGEMLTQQQYETTVGQTLNLLGTSALGIVNVPFNTFSSVSFTGLLNPLNETNSLYLNGTHEIGQTSSSGGNVPVPNTTIPVQVMISDPAILNSVWINGVTINQLNYTATLFFDLSQLTNGITPQMLETAATSHGVVVISSTSNQNLYGIIVSNLKNNLMNVQLLPLSLTINTQSTVNPHVE